MSLIGLAMKNLLYWGEKSKGRSSEKERQSVECFILIGRIHVLLPTSFVVNSRVSLHACGTQMTDRFTMLDILLTESANHYEAFCSTSGKWPTRLSYGEQNWRRMECMDNPLPMTI